MKKRLLVLLAAAVLVLGGASSALAENVRMAAGVVGSMNFSLATGFSAVYQKHTGQTLEVLTKELTATVPQLYSGGYEIASQVNAAAYIFYNNIDPRTLEPTGSKERPPLRLVMLGNASPASFVVLKSSGMTKASDLKGKRVTLRFGHFSAQLMVKINLLASGLTENEVSVVQASNIPKGAEMLRDGAVDACFGTTSVAAFRELDAAKNIRFLAHDPSPENEKKIREVFPGAIFIKVNPDPGLVGVPEPTWMIGNHNSLISATNTPDDVIYKFVKTIYENRQELLPYSPDFEEWVNTPPVSTYAAAPFHTGAIKYYKEAGLWTPEMEAWNQKLLDIYKD